MVDHVSGLGRQGVAVAGYSGYGRLPRLLDDLLRDARSALLEQSSVV